MLQQAQEQSDPGQAGEDVEGQAPTGRGIHWACTGIRRSGSGIFRAARRQGLADSTPLSEVAARFWCRQPVALGALFRVRRVLHCFSFVFPAARPFARFPCVALHREESAPPKKACCDSSFACHLVAWTHLQVGRRCLICCLSP